MVAVSRQQLTLPGTGRAGAQAVDPPHDQPPVDVLCGGPAGERDVVDLGYFRVRDPPLLVLVVDRVGVADRDLRGLLDARDRPHHSRVVAGGHRKARATAAGRGDDVVVVERRVRPYHHQPTRRPAGASTRPPRGDDRVGDQPGSAAGEFVAPRRSRVATITGAASGELTVAISAFNPFTPE